MPVVFTTISDKFIAMCADKSENEAPKIEKWSAHIAVGMSGDMAAGEYVRSTVHQFATESGISNFNAEDIANLFVQKCGTIDNTTETTKFIIAGKLANKKLGAVVVRADGNRADSETFESGKVPATLILEPADLSVEQCNIQFGKALKNVEGKFLKNTLESIHRRAVKNVSELSEFVNRESEYILITP